MSMNDLDDLRREARGLLCDIWDELAARADTKDGADGRPIPNWALSLMTKIDGWLEREEAATEKARAEEDRILRREGDA